MRTLVLGKMERAFKLARETALKRIPRVIPMTDLIRQKLHRECIIAEVEPSFEGSELYLRCYSKVAMAENVAWSVPSALPYDVWFSRNYSLSLRS